MQNYKQRLLKDQQSIDMYLEELKQDEVEVPYMRLYRVTNDSSFDGMKAEFLRDPQNGKKYQILKTCLENEGDIEKLQKFFAVIEFTTSLLPQFNH